MKRYGLQGLLALIIILLTAFLAAPRAWADESAPINRWNVDVNLSRDGVAHVNAELEMDFSNTRGRGPVFVLPTRQPGGEDGQFYRYKISGIQVSSSTAPDQTQTTEDKEGNIQVRVGNANRYLHDKHVYRISYTVTGLIAPDHPKSHLDEFNWNVIGNWRGRINNFTVKVTGPENVSKAACWTGSNYKQSCASGRSGKKATYSLPSISPGTPVQVVAGFPAGTFPGVKQDVEYQRTLGNSFSLTPITGAATLVTTAGAAFAIVKIRKRRTRDEAYLGVTPGLSPRAGQEEHIGFLPDDLNVAVQFHPPKNATPGEIGTLMDANADFIDVSASIIDLAVRGYLVITAQKDGDHLLTRTKKNQEELADYEEQLLSKLFQSGDKVTLKELGDEKYDGLDSEIRDLLYLRVTELGWFRESPNSMRWTGKAIGFFVIIMGCALSGVFGYGLGWGLVFLPVVAVGIAVLMMSGKFGKRTAKGSAALVQARGFELYLSTAEADKLRFEEGVDIFSRYLPYAMIFGVAQRWTELFAQLKKTNRFETDTSWYRGVNLHASNNVFYTRFNNFCYDFSDAMVTAHEAARASSYSSSSFSSSSYTSSGTSGGSGFSGGGGFSGGWARIAGPTLNVETLKEPLFPSRLLRYRYAWIGAQLGPSVASFSSSLRNNGLGFASGVPAMMGRRSHTACWAA